MSTSDLYRVYRTKATHYAEMRNGWGTAPAIWDYLAQKYLGRGPAQYLRANDTELWDLARSPQVPRDFRLVHAFCCDQSMCPLDRLTELADACLVVWKAIGEFNPNAVNHWATVANFLKGHQRKPKQIGVGLSCTSVNDTWISWKPEQTQAPWDIFAYVDQTAAAA